MASRINNFEYKNQSMTELLPRETMTQVPEIIENVNTVSAQLVSITEKLKKLVQKDIRSSSFYSTTNDIIDISNTINDSLVVFTKSLLTDAYDRILQVQEEDLFLKENLGIADKFFKAALAIMENVGGGKVGKIPNSNMSVNANPVVETPAPAAPAPQETITTAEVKMETVMAAPPQQEINTLTQNTPAAPTNPNWSGPVLTKSMGVNQGPSGKETYYNLNMSRVVENMHNQGFEGEYWVRDDGVKMFGNYVMVAANLDVHPRGSIVESSLGPAIVCDTGGFAANNPNQLDIAVSW